MITKPMDQFNSPWYGFVLGALAVWRVTHLFHVEHGPWGLIAGFRAAADRRGAGEVFRCFFCLSLWIAAPVSWWLAVDWPERIVTWLGLSATAILIEIRGLVAPSAPESSRK
jgi:hypothetical protein